MLFVNLVSTGQQHIEYMLFPQPLLMYLSHYLLDNFGMAFASLQNTCLAHRQYN